MAPDDPLPDPDGFGDINRDSRLEQSQGPGVDRRRHPKDAYEPLRQKRGCQLKGCLFLLFIFVLLPLGGGLFWVKSEQGELVKNQGFLPVTVREKTVASAPKEKTAYLGLNGSFTFPDTKTEVAFLGGQWTLGGIFREKVTFRGAQLLIAPGSQFLKGLDVEAIRFETSDAVIEGDLTGRIIHQTSSK